MMLPTCTYRIQFNAQFTFQDLNEVLGYLQQLGISTIYASPILKSRLGSTHGYDGLDPYHLDPEIGTLETFRIVAKGLQEKNLSWLQDIVPNHMAYDAANPWLSDIFELGPVSKYYRYFDINWNDSGKVMAPILGEPLEQVLEKEELKMGLNEKGLSLKYYDHLLPLSARSYALILEGLDFDGWEEKFKNFSGEQMEWEDLKVNFYLELQENPSWEQQIPTGAERGKWMQILDLQYFEPVHWQLTDKEITYRRFFTINDLICLRMEEEEVFEEYHYFLKELFNSGLVQGLRIDHIDGLFSPPAYLRQLRNKFGEEPFFVVEKILEGEEHLPKNWPIQGSTGYEFLALINQLFIASANEKAFTEGYNEIQPELPPYQQLVLEKKSFILREKMGGELDNLVAMLYDLELVDQKAQDRKHNVKAALAAVLTSFPVYRIYAESFPLNESQKQVLDTAFEKAGVSLPELGEEIKLLKRIFYGEAEADQGKLLYFLQRSQQFTGPLAAKGVEDTLFYIYNRLISQNEVGDSPSRFGISAPYFHQQMKHRQETHPHSLNATATHDTKRGEDARMRINVLSELPEEWFAKVVEWREMNSHCKNDKEIPDANEEYFIYQSLIGGFPFAKEEVGEFPNRFSEYLKKALREAKLHSNWSNPDEEYEQRVIDFVSGILCNDDFRKSFEPFLDKIGFYGTVKSLGQVLLKTTAPGIPDVYQGTELWDFSFVDPDNRRPVDYIQRDVSLKEIQTVESGNLKDKLQVWLKNYRDSTLKLYVLSTALDFRRKHRELFERGEYIPLETTDTQKDEILAYARRLENHWVLVIVPVLVTELFSAPGFLGIEISSEIILPERAPTKWRNVLTGKEIEVKDSLSLSACLMDFPVGLFKNIN